MRVDAGETHKNRKSMVRKTTLEFRASYNNTPPEKGLDFSPFRVTNFKMIGMNEDFNFSMTRSDKLWKKTKLLIDKVNPSYKEERKKLEADISDWRK